MKHIPAFEKFINEKMNLNTVISASDKDYTWIYQTGKDSSKTAKEISKKLNDIGIKSFVSKTTGDTVAIPTKDLQTAFNEVISKYDNIKQFAYKDNTKIDKNIVNECFHTVDGIPIGVDNMHRPITGPIKEASDEMVTLNVTISNIDKSTADDFLKMFAFMEYCGNVGTARTFRGFCDGDGHFRPDIKVEGVDLTDIDLGLTDDTNKQIDLDLDFGA